eukprot:284606-Hanusia_phi.AAC.4
MGRGLAGRLATGGREGGREGGEAMTTSRYEEMAVELGNNKNALEGMKAKLREARLTAPLFDTARWVGGAVEQTSLT